MGGLRTIVVGLCLILLDPARSASAQTSQPSDPMQLFATCAGRLSALMEYQWLVQDPGADATEARRDQMVNLLEAALPNGAAAQAMNLRLQAKVAEAALLQRSLARDGAWALRLARHQVTDCAALLVS